MDVSDFIDTLSGTEEGVITKGVSSLEGFPSNKKGLKTSRIFRKGRILLASQVFRQNWLLFC